MDTYRGVAEGKIAPPPIYLLCPPPLISVDRLFLNNFMQHMHMQYLNSLLCPPKNYLASQIISPKRPLDATKYPLSAKCV